MEKQVSDKLQIRAQAIKRLQYMGNVERASQTKGLLSALQAYPAYIEATRIAAFYPMGIELDLRPLFEDQSKLWLLPKCLPKRQMVFIRYEGDPAALVKSNFGLLEPIGEAEEADLIIVPGLAWDQDGYRIGFGGGYYDRYLAKFAGRKLSLAFDFQLIEKIPRETFDIAVDEVLTNVSI